ncbi:MAG: hypothetical protein Q7R34_01530, partial [Dehalococcoidia bacterium]|nr:hypothetical protein [Dehalococcoidia bacterium]
LPKNFKVPQRVFIHASLTMYPGASLEELRPLLLPTQRFNHWATIRRIFDTWNAYRGRPEVLKKDRYFGHILGSVVITGQVTESTDPWFFGPFGFTMEYPELLPKPIPWKGYFKFFEVDQIDFELMGLEKEETSEYH